MLTRSSPGRLTGWDPSASLVCTTHRCTCINRPQAAHVRGTLAWVLSHTLRKEIEEIQITFSFSVFWDESSLFL